MRPEQPDSGPELKPDSGPQKGWGGAEIGINLVVCVLIGGGLGYALDSWLGWRPWAMLGGGLLGFAAWFRTLMKL